VWRLNTEQGQYDYTPGIAPFFECTFTLSTDNTSTIVTAGQTLRTTYPEAEPSFDIICPSPISIEKKTTFQLSLVWLGRDEPAVRCAFFGRNFTRGCHWFPRLLASTARLKRAGV
jgi:hypothetical protein